MAKRGCKYLEVRDDIERGVGRTGRVKRNEGKHGIEFMKVVTIVQ